MVDSNAGGLRERKRARTRALIIDVADRMFVDRGFDNVTLAEIASACEVSVRTVLRYFDSKEGLALAPEYDSLERFRAGLANRKGDTLAYWRNHVEESVAEIGATAEWHRQRRAMVRDVPALSARLAGVHNEFQQLLAAAIYDDTDKTDHLGARLLAAMLVAGNESVAQEWLSSGDPLDARTLLAAVDYAVELFAGRLGHGTGLGHRRKPGRRTRR
jgi:AcrR family transcriptional regulator